MDHWKNYCTISLVHFMAFPELQSGAGDFEATIRQVGGMGLFGALEMGPINEAADRRVVKRTADELGLRLAYGAQPLILSKGLDLNHPDPAYRTKALDGLFEGVKQAAEIGAESFVVLSGKDPGDQQRAEAYQHLADSLSVLEEHSERYGIRTVLEVFDRAVDKKALVGPASEAANLAEKLRVEYPEFGLLYDMGHMPLNDESPEKALPVLSPFLDEVHLGNCIKTPGHPAYGDKHPRIGYPGGVNDISELALFLRELVKIGYLTNKHDPANLPWVGFEVRPQEGETSQAILESIKTTWEEAWAQI